MTEKPYPYQNKQAADLIGEFWKEIPGFEGYFQVSSLGRVKSLDRTIPHSRCGTQFVKGRILSQNPKKHFNAFTKDYTIILHVCLMLENKRYEYPVRRLVYAAFVDASLLKGDKRMVIAKDGNGYNCRLDNLQLVTNSEKQKRILEKGRVYNTLAMRDHRTFKPTYGLWKPVHKCDAEGKVLATYPNIRMAARAEGFDEKGIINAAKGRTNTYKEFQWKYADRDVLKNHMNESRHLASNEKDL
ncbi:MAG TPA: NUMOD4 domain-containing protein [Flavisolibacter sp.]|nr:NUMOD4 domain-containing protein [Flavisolibacter sp.]